MSSAAYPSRVAIAQALACLGGKAAEASNYRGPLAKVHELLSENPPKVESAAVAAAVGVEVTCPIQPEAPAERQAEAWLLAAVHELLTSTSTSCGDSAAGAAQTAAPAVRMVDGEPRRLALAAACEVSALAGTLWRMADSSADDFMAVVLMAGRVRALSEALYGLIEQGPTVAIEAELGALVKLTDWSEA